MKFAVPLAQKGGEKVGSGTHVAWEKAILIKGMHKS